MLNILSWIFDHQSTPFRNNISSLQFANVSFTKQLSISDAVSLTANRNSLGKSTRTLSLSGDHIVHDVPWRVRSAVNEAGNFFGAEYLAGIERNTILPSPSFLPPSNIVVLSVARPKKLRTGLCWTADSVFICASIDVRDRMPKLREYETRWRRFRFSFRCRFVIRCYPYYVLRMFRGSKMTSVIIFWIYVNFTSNVRSSWLCSAPRGMERYI